MSPNDWKEWEYEETPSVIYKGQRIVPRPRQQVSEWTTEVQIWKREGTDDLSTFYSASNTFPTRDEAWKQSAEFGKQIIDEKVTPKKIVQE